MVRIGCSQQSLVKNLAEPVRRVTSADNFTRWLLYDFKVQHAFDCIGGRDLYISENIGEKMIGESLKILGQN